jgi:3-hydroxyisobutyrate dehydrogenase-like beta-hydroxyacid dehydrogenase
MHSTQHPVGIIGLGLVGQALAQRLAVAGFKCLGFDVSADAMARFAQAGHTCAPSVAALAASVQTVVLAVFDTAGVLHITEGLHAVHSLSASTTGITLIDCSTGDPDQLAALAGRLQARGIGFIEAPLSGSSAQIAAGQATMLLGGDNATLAAHATLLAALSPQRIHVGGAGMGARAKLATNLVLGLNRAALAEGMVFAQNLGIAPETFLQLVLATPARSDAALVKGPQMVAQQFAPQSRIRQHLKDVRIMLSAAQARGQHLPLSTAHAALMQAAVDAGDGDLDNAAIIQQIRRTTPALVTSSNTLPQK